MMGLFAQFILVLRALRDGKLVKISVFVISLPAAFGVKLFFFFVIFLSPGESAQYFLLINTAINGMNHLAIADVLILPLISLVYLLLERHFRLLLSHSSHELPLVL
jgi:hypothetical protein